MEYSVVPLPPDVVIVIVPSSTPQFVGSVLATLSITGGIGATRISSVSVTSQVPSMFLTLILYVPAIKPVNVPDCDQEAPSLIEYSTAPCALDAVIVIVPSLTPQSVGLVEVTDEMTGAILSVNTSIGPNTSQEPSAFFT